jgi:hypothetical protein
MIRENLMILQGNMKSKNTNGIEGTREYHKQLSKKSTKKF